MTKVIADGHGAGMLTEYGAGQRTTNSQSDGKINARSNVIDQGFLFLADYRMPCASLGLAKCSHYPAFSPHAWHDLLHGVGITAAPELLSDGLFYGQ